MEMLAIIIASTLVSWWLHEEVDAAVRRERHRDWINGRIARKWRAV